MWGGGWHWCLLCPPPKVSSTRPRTWQASAVSSPLSPREKTRQVQAPSWKEWHREHCCHFHTPRTHFSAPTLTACLRGRGHLRAHGGLQHRCPRLPACLRWLPCPGSPRCCEEVGTHGRGGQPQASRWPSSPVSNVLHTYSRFTSKQSVKDGHPVNLERVVAGCFWFSS